jgi:hypothetical protein
VFEEVVDNVEELEIVWMDVEMEIIEMEIDLVVVNVEVFVD